VIKLIAKTSEERYQTASGAESDSVAVLGECEARGAIAEFSLGEHDAQSVSDSRRSCTDEHRNQGCSVRSSVWSAGGGPALCWFRVSGMQIRFVNELHKALNSLRGLFASGKFDQYKRDIPYATLAKALRA